VTVSRRFDVQSAIHRFQDAESDILHVGALNAGNRNLDPVISSKHPTDSKTAIRVDPDRRWYSCDQRPQVDIDRRGDAIENNPAENIRRW